MTIDLAVALVAVELLVGICCVEAGCGATTTTADTSLPLVAGCCASPVLRSSGGPRPLLIASQMDLGDLTRVGRLLLLSPTTSGAASTRLVDRGARLRVGGDIYAVINNNNTINGLIIQLLLPGG